MRRSCVCSMGERKLTSSWEMDCPLLQRRKGCRTRTTMEASRVQRRIRKENNVAGPERKN